MLSFFYVKFLSLEIKETKRIMPRKHKRKTLKAKARRLRLRRRSESR